MLSYLTAAYDDNGVGMHNGLTVSSKSVRYEFTLTLLQQHEFESIIIRIVMRACPALAVSAVPSVVDCVGCVAVAVVVLVGAVATHVEDNTAAGLSFSHEELYQDYPSPDPQTGAGGEYPTGYEGGYFGPGAGGYPGGGYGAGAYEVEPSRQIMVRKVSPVLASL